MSYRRFDCRRRRGTPGLQANDVGSEYTDAELELLRAVDAWRRQNRCRFPTCTDILAIAVALGYRKAEPPPA